MCRQWHTEEKNADNYHQTENCGGSEQTFRAPAIFIPRARNIQPKHSYHNKMKCRTTTYIYASEYAGIKKMSKNKTTFYKLRNTPFP